MYINPNFCVVLNRQNAHWHKSTPLLSQSYALNFEFLFISFVLYKSEVIIKKTNRCKHLFIILNSQFITYKAILLLYLFLFLFTNMSKTAF
jgi:hypothetical protein